MTLPSSEHPRQLARMVAVAALLILYYVMAVSAASQKSMTFDEMAHLTGGYTYWAFDDYRLHPENGNWPQRLGALPAVVGGVVVPPARSARLDHVERLRDRRPVPVLQRQRCRHAAASRPCGDGAGRRGAWRPRLRVGQATGVASGGAWVSLAAVRIQPYVAGARSARHVRHGRRTFLHGGSWCHVGCDAPGDARHCHRCRGARGRLLCCRSSRVRSWRRSPSSMLAVRVIGGGRLTVGFRGTAVEYTGRARQLAVLLGVARWSSGSWRGCCIWASYGFRYTAFAAATTGKDAFLGQVTDQPGIVGRFLSTARQDPPAARCVHLRPRPHGAVRVRARGVSQRSIRDDRLVVVLPVRLHGEDDDPRRWSSACSRWPRSSCGGRPTARADLADARGPAFTRARRCWHSCASTGRSRSAATSTSVIGICCRSIRHCASLPAARRFGSRRYLRGRRIGVAQTGRERRKQRAQARAQRSTSGSVGRFLVCRRLAFWRGTWESRSPIRPNYLAYFNQLAGGPSKDTSTWPTAHWIGDRTCRR